MKIVFFGTPEFAALSLERLLRSSHTVVAVVTQPDTALKHGKTELSAVGKVAEKYGLTTFKPEKIRTESEYLRSFGADIGVTAAYGQILNADVIDSFPYGIINVHASLLPKYRGASPIYSAILNGERETGVTIIKTELGLDTGDILSCAKTEINDGENATELTKRLAEIGAELLVDTLDNFADIKPVKQDNSAATVCKTIKKQQQYIDFSRDARSVVNMIRALADTPCAKTVINGEVYKVYAATVGVGSGKIGEIIHSEKKLTVACGDGAVDITEIQAPGKKRLPIADFLRGRKLPLGAICETN